MRHLCFWLMLLCLPLLARAEDPVLVRFAHRKIQAYQVDPQGLKAKAVGAPIKNPDVSAALVAPGGKLIYATAKYKLVRFQFDPIKGLRALHGTWPLGTDGDCLAIHPSGRWLYSGDILRMSVFALDGATPRQLKVSNRPGSQLLMHPSGEFLFAWGYDHPNSDRFLVSYKVGADGLPQEVHRLTIKEEVWDTAISPDGNWIWTLGLADEALKSWRVDSQSGRVELAKSTDTFAGGKLPDKLLAAPGGNDLWILNAFPEFIREHFRFDLKTGAFEAKERTDHTDGMPLLHPLANVGALVGAMGQSLCRVDASGNVEQGDRVLAEDAYLNLWVR